MPAAPFPIEPGVPGWCVPGPRAVEEAWEALHRRHARTPRDVGVLDALGWVGLGDTAPLSWVVGRTATDARAESWLALCASAGAPAPTARDWERLGVSPRTIHPQVVADAADLEYPYGVWTTCAWLLGVREDWPIYTSWHLASQLPNPHPHLGERPAERDPAWYVADAASREQARAEAWRWWAHVRHRADATEADWTADRDDTRREPSDR